jgi:hypothetical protein
MENWKEENNLEEASRLNYLAIGYENLGIFSKALDYYEKSLIIK